jgi:hypothetical protein
MSTLASKKVIRSPSVLKLKFKGKLPTLNDYFHPMHDYMKVKIYDKEILSIMATAFEGKKVELWIASMNSPSN